MDLCRFQFHLLRVFAACVILVHLNSFVSAAPVISSEIQAMRYLRTYGNVNESSLDSPSFMNRSKRELEVQVPDLCADATLNAATITADGRMYLFQGQFYWEVTGFERTIIADGYPKKISDDWGGLPGNLDAALTWSAGSTFFFKENLYWKFKNKEMESGYPKEISEGFAGIPNGIDAAFVWSKNKKTYFFKGSKYWRYVHSDEPPSPVSYPRPISEWTGLPDNIDAVMQWDNKENFFFKGTQYYRFDDNTGKVAEDPSRPPYPRPTSDWWLGCEEWRNRKKQLDRISTTEDGTGSDNNLATSSSSNEELDTKFADSSSTNLLPTWLLIVFSLPFIC